MASNNGQAISADTINEMKTEFENLSREEMIIENRSLKETLTVCLEFKRILENLFEDHDVAKSGVAQKYKQHYWKNFHKYRAYRKAFGDHLVKTIDNLDSQHLTKCFNSDCKLPDCSDIDNEFLRVGPLNDERPASPAIVKKMSNGIVQPKVSGNNSDITGQKPITSVVAEEAVNGITRKKFEVSEDSKKKEEDVSNSDDVIIEDVSDHSPKRGSTEETAEIVKESTNVDSINAPAETQMDTQNDLQIEDTENTASAVNDNAESCSSLTSSGPSPSKRLRSTESADEKVNTANSGKETFEQTENTETILLEESEEVEWVTEEVEDNADEQTLDDNNDGSTITLKIQCRAEDCDESFDTVAEATKHYETHAKIYKCSQCPLLYSSKASVFRHFLTHNPQPANVQQKETT